jgi:hypothetical protein
VSWRDERREGGREGGDRYLVREEAVEQPPAHDCPPVGVAEGKSDFLAGEMVALAGEDDRVADT